MCCAFLRGVNVNGRNMKMAEVCETFRSAGMKAVSSVLATGNIIFQSDEDNPILCKTLEFVLNEHFQMESRLYIKSVNEIKAMLDAVPYMFDPDWHIYAFICDLGFEQVLVEEFNTITQDRQSDELAVVHNEYFFWRVRKGSTLDMPFSKILSSRKFREKFTSRNIGTVEKVYGKMSYKEDGI